jgi:hypothetical protein
MMKPPEGTVRRRPLMQAVLAFAVAVKDSRVEDALPLVDPKVICFALVRPGLSVYHGYEGVASLVAYLHAAYGNYEMEIAKIAEVPGLEVTVRMRIMPEPGYQQPPPLAVTTYTFRNGLIAAIESEPATSVAGSR